MQIGHGHQGVLIGEYSFYRRESTEHNSDLKPGSISDGASSDKNRVIGWLEPASARPSWIIWFTEQGDAIIYANREAGGVVIGDPIRLKASGQNTETTQIRLPYSGEFVEVGGKFVYMESTAVFYGPHACDQCGVTICKMGREYGHAIYTYPEGPIYPNTQWEPHVCQQRDIERVNGLLSLGFRRPGDPMPESPETL